MKQIAKKCENAARKLGDFQSQMGEEEMTTRAFKISGSALTFTATVYYTDESLPGDLALLCVAVSKKESRNACGENDNSMAELTLADGVRIVRVKKQILLRGRIFVAGLECHYSGYEFPPWK